MIVPLLGVVLLGVLVVVVVIIGLGWKMISTGSLDVPLIPHTLTALTEIM